MPARPIRLGQPKREPEDVGERRSQAEPARQPHERVMREAVDEDLRLGTAGPTLGGETPRVRGAPRMEDSPPAAGR
jgi:hypothetical protein